MSMDEQCSRSSIPREPPARTLCRDWFSTLLVSCVTVVITSDKQFSIGVPKPIWTKIRTRDIDSRRIDRARQGKGKPAK